MELAAKTSTKTVLRVIPARRLALGLVAGPVLFTAAWLILGFLSPGYTAWGAYVPYSPVHQTVSGLGLGPTGPFMNAAFLANGALTLMGTVAAFRSLSGMGRRAAWTCTALLALPAAGSVVDGLFTLESFLPHFAGFALVLTVVAGFPITGVLLRRIPTWRRLGGLLIAAGPLTLVLAVLFFATFTPTIAGMQTGIAGLTERLLIVQIQAWFIAIGWKAFQADKG